MGKAREVEAWLKDYDNPMRDVVLRLRDIVLGADKRMEECIKWQAPTFTAEGKNLASFFPKSKQHASLMFHEGAKIPGKHTCLTGAGATSRVLKAGTVAEANKQKKQIEAVVGAWLTWKLASTPKKKAVKKKAVKKKAVKKKAVKKK